MTLAADLRRGGYGRTTVLEDVSVEVGPGEVVALLGSNGSGKSTSLRLIAGLTPLESGSVVVDGADLTRQRAEARPRHGIAHVPEGRQLFPLLSVEDNLRLGAFTRRKEAGDALEFVYALFPILAERRSQQAGSLSGGQAQMLAIGRGLMCRPKYVLLDEPALGLAPMVIARVFETVAELARDGVGVLVAEQNAKVALAAADRAYVLERGRVVLAGTGAELLDDERVAESYLGGAVV